MTSQPIVLQDVIIDVCDFLLEYIHTFHQHHSSMKLLEYIQSIKDRPAIVDIVTQMQGDLSQLGDPPEQDIAKIEQVWNAVKNHDKNTINLIKQEIDKFRAQSTFETPPGPETQRRPHQNHDETHPQSALQDRRPTSVTGPTLARMRGLLALSV